MKDVSKYIITLYVLSFTVILEIWGFTKAPKRLTAGMSARARFYTCDWTTRCQFMACVRSRSANRLACCWLVHRYAGRVAAWKRGRDWRRQHRLYGAVLWTPGTMSRPGRQKISWSCSTCQFQAKHRARGSRKNCQESSKTSTENCVGNTGRVSSLGGPLCLSVALQPQGLNC